MSLSAVGGVSFLKIKHNRSLVFLDCHSRFGCNRRVKLFWFWSIVFLKLVKVITFVHWNPLFVAEIHFICERAVNAKQGKRKSLFVSHFARGVERSFNLIKRTTRRRLIFHSWDGERRCFVQMYAARRIQRSRFVYVHERKYLSAAGVFTQKTMLHTEKQRHLRYFWVIFQRCTDASCRARETSPTTHLKILRENKSSTSFDWIFVYFLYKPC